MNIKTAQSVARTIGRSIIDVQTGPILLTRGTDPDPVAVLVSARDARRVRLICEHDDEPATCPACALPESYVCPHGVEISECQACAVAGDLAYDAAREKGR